MSARQCEAVVQKSRPKGCIATMRPDIRELNFCRGLLSEKFVDLICFIARPVFASHLLH